MRRQLASVLAVAVFAGLAMGSTDGGSPPADPVASTDTIAAPPPPAPNTHFAHGTLNVRSGPGQGHRVLRKLQRGDTLSLAEPDANGWARVMGADSGYVSTRVGLLRTEAPAEVPAYAAAGECAEAMRAVHTRMNRPPDAIKEFREKELREVTWWYRERPRDLHPKHQFSFLTGPYTEGCRMSELES